MESTFVLYGSGALWEEHEAVLAALYLRGAPRAFHSPWRSWLAVLRCLRQSGSGLAGAEVTLRRAGFGLQAAALSVPGLLSWAEGLCQRGQAITPCSPRYPRHWLEFLGGSAPAALWVRGEVPHAPVLGVAGSRRAPRSALSFAEGVGAEAVRLGMAVACGGAEGSDRAAARGAAREHRRLRGPACPCPVIEVLPYGLQWAAARSVGCAITACAPHEPFTAAAAMERNGWVYALGDFAVVVHANFKSGGTWAGATDALRRRLCRLIVREDPQSPAHRALASLGAEPLSDPRLLATSLSGEPRRAGLGENDCLPAL